MQGLLKKNEKNLIPCYNFKFRYINVLSLKISKFGDHVDCVFLIKRKDTPDTAMSASYIDLHLEIDSDHRLRTDFTTKEMFSIFSENIPLYPFCMRKLSWK